MIVDLASSGVCQFLIADDFYCGNPAPRRSAFCVFHSEVAAIQRKADVSSRAGHVSANAERRLGIELAKIPRAPGTRGQIVGAASGVSKSDTPDAHFNARNPIIAAPKSDAPTLAEKGVEPTSVSIDTDEEASAATIEPVGVALLDLNSFTCRWPIGDPLTDLFRYCGAPSPVGKPYCSFHHGIAHEPARHAVRRRNQTPLIASDSVGI